MDPQPSGLQFPRLYAVGYIEQAGKLKHSLSHLEGTPCPCLPHSSQAGWSLGSQPGRVALRQGWQEPSPYWLQLGLAVAEPGMRAAGGLAVPLSPRLDLCHTHACGLSGLRGTLPSQPERGDADEVGLHLPPGPTRQGPCCRTSVLAPPKSLLGPTSGWPRLWRALGRCGVHGKPFPGALTQCPGSHSPWRPGPGWS